MNSAVVRALKPASVAYTAPRPKRMPCDAPVKNIPTSPVGAVRASSRRPSRSASRTGGASVVAAREIGTNDIDTRIDATTKSTYPLGSAVTISS